MNPRAARTTLGGNANHGLEEHMLGFFSRRFPITGVLGGLALLAWGYSRGAVVPEVAGALVALVSGVRVIGSATGNGK